MHKEMILPVVIVSSFLLNFGLSEQLHYGSYKVVGGAPVIIEQFPFMAGLFMHQGGDIYSMCGGSIVGDRWILTAAHCVYKVSPRDITVLTGDKRMGHGERHLVSSTFPHPKYNEYKNDNDIALIRLKSPLTKYKKVLLAADDAPNKSRCTLIGWGKMSKNGSNPKQLQEADVYITSCMDLRKRLFLDGMRNTDSILCTSTMNGKGGCQGDSGGPLLLNGIQIGVVSSGEPCATGSPDTYTKVSYYKNWILNTVQRNN